MSWSEVILTLGLSAIFGLPVLGFSLYWIAEYLGLKVKERKHQLSGKEAEELRAELARLQARLDQIQGNELRLGQVEEQLAFIERLLDERSAIAQLSPGASDLPRA